MGQARQGIKRVVVCTVVLTTVAQLTSIEFARAQVADEPGLNTDGSAAPHHSVALDVPRVAYTDTAFGVGPGVLGAAGFGEVRGSAAQGSDPRLGGGIRLWVSPIDRLLLVLDAQRRDSNNQFAPAATAQVRIVGSEREGWALGALARYKTEGFATLESEVEAGLLGSVNRNRLHVDLNLVVGGDFDGQEGDGELLVRGGYEVLPFFRVGAEGRGRYRVAGNTDLPGGRTWDVFAGPQLFAFSDHYFGALTAGPSTVAMVDRLGWSAIACAGGVMF